MSSDLRFVCVCFVVIFATALGCATHAPAASQASTTTSAPAAHAPSVILVTEELGHPHIGDRAPDFDLIDQNGQPEKLSALRGSIVVVALAASWCPFSKAAQPHLAELAASYAPRGVRTLGVVIADDDAGYHSYVTRTNMPFPVAFDTGDKVALAYAPEHAHPSFKDRRKVSVSSNLVIDKDGVIRYFGLADTTNFDAELTLVRQELDRQLAAAPTPALAP